MERELYREVRVFENAVDPGFLYDEEGKKCYKRGDEKVIQCKECPVKFKMKCWNMDTLLYLAQSSSISGRKWLEDFVHESPVDAIFVRGVKVFERKGVDVPLDYSKHTVTSVFYKSSVDMLVAFKEKMTKEASEEFRNYLECFLNGISESHIPKLILNGFQSAHIYPSFTSPGTRLIKAKHGFMEFCHLLQESKVSTIPITVYITRPREQCADTDGTCQMLEAASPTQGVHHVSADSTIIANPSSVNENNGKFSEVVMSNQDGVPGVHLFKKSSKEEVVQDRDICSISENRDNCGQRQSQGSGDDEASKISVSLGASELKSKETNANGLSGSEKNYSNFKPSNREDISHQKSSGTQEYNHSVNKDNYNKHKSSCQSSKPTSINDKNTSVVAESKRPSCIDKENNNKPRAELDKILSVKRQIEGLEGTDHSPAGKVNKSSELTNTNLPSETNRSNELESPDTSENMKPKSECNSKSQNSQPMQTQESAQREYNEKELGNGSECWDNDLNKERSSISPKRKSENLGGDTSDKKGKGSPDDVVPTAEKKTAKEDLGNVIHKGQICSENTSNSGILPTQPENKNTSQKGADIMKRNKQSNKTNETEKFNNLKSKLLLP